MGERTWGRKYRNTVVCVDSYEDGIPIGSISNPYLSEPKPFCGVTQFLKEMEQMLDEMKLPQSFTETRTFGTPSFAEETAVSPLEQLGKGKLATFVVNVLFRQNTSWQGTVTWLDKNREESFRSVLELLMLLDSALTVSK